MTDDLSKKIEALINKIQSANTNYLMQDNQISHAKKSTIAVILSLLLLAGILTFLTSTLMHRGQMDLRILARHQLMLMYSANTLSVVADHHNTTNIALKWHEAALRYRGVENIQLLTQRCESIYFPWQAITCHFGYETQFNAGQTSMTYTVTLTQGRDSLIINNAQAAVTPQPLENK